MLQIAMNKFYIILIKLHLYKFKYMYHFSLHSKCEASLLKNLYSVSFSLS